MNIEDFGKITNLIEKRTKLINNINELNSQIENHNDIIFEDSIFSNYDILNGSKIPFGRNNSLSLITYALSLTQIELENVEKELIDFGVNINEQTS